MVADAAYYCAALVRLFSLASSVESLRRVCSRLPRLFAKSQYEQSNVNELCVPFVLFLDQSILATFSNEMLLFSLKWLVR